jgi:hypothetical protein
VGNAQAVTMTVNDNEVVEALELTGLMDDDDDDKMDEMMTMGKKRQ